LRQRNERTKKKPTLRDKIWRTKIKRSKVEMEKKMDGERDRDEEDESQGPCDKQVSGHHRF
jgi:hypothetical protein